MDTKSEEVVSKEQEQKLLKEIEEKIGKVIHHIDLLRFIGNDNESMVASIKDDLAALYVKSLKFGDDGLDLGIKLMELYKAVKEFESEDKKRKSIESSIVKKIKDREGQTIGVDSLRKEVSEKPSDVNR